MYASLKGKIISAGESYASCAKALEISTTAFCNKINGKSVFKVPEAQKLSQILHLDDKEKIKIFLS